MTWLQHCYWQYSATLDNRTRGWWILVDPLSGPYIILFGQFIIYVLNMTFPIWESNTESFSLFLQMQAFRVSLATWARARVCGSMAMRPTTHSHLHLGPTVCPRTSCRRAMGAFSTASPTSPKVSLSFYYLSSQHDNGKNYSNFGLYWDHEDDYLKSLHCIFMLLNWNRN